MMDISKNVGGLVDCCQKALEAPGPDAELATFGRASSSFVVLKTGSCVTKGLRTT